MKKTMFFGLMVFFVSCLLVLNVTGYAKDEKAGLPSDVIILFRGATSGTGPILVAMAELTTKYTPMQATNQETSGSKAGTLTLDAGRADFHGSTAATIRDAYYGVGSFDKPANIMQVAAINENVFAFQARGGTGITKMEDLRGKKVMCNIPAQPWLTEVGKGLLEFYGMSWDDIKVLKSTGLPGWKSGMMDRRADVVLAVSRGAWRIEVAKSVGMVNLPLSKEAIQYVKEKYEPVIYYSELSPRLLNDVGMDPKAKVGVIGAMSNLVCRADLSDEVVYLVVKSYYDHFDEAKTYGKVCEAATLELAVSDFNIPIHPGAIKYYKEKGVWTAEHEKRQQALLAKPKGKK